jgi:hypothetical protein
MPLSATSDDIDAKLVELKLDTSAVPPDVRQRFISFIQAQFDGALADLDSAALSTQLLDFLDNLDDEGPGAVTSDRRVDFELPEFSVKGFVYKLPRPPMEYENDTINTDWLFDNIFTGGRRSVGVKLLNKSYDTLAAQKFPSIVKAAEVDFYSISKARTKEGYSAPNLFNLLPPEGRGHNVWVLYLNPAQRSKQMSPWDFKLAMQPLRLWKPYITKAHKKGLFADRAVVFASDMIKHWWQFADVVHDIADIAIARRVIPLFWCSIQCREFLYTVMLVFSEHALRSMITAASVLGESIRGVTADDECDDILPEVRSAVGTLADSGKLRFAFGVTDAFASRKYVDMSPQGFTDMSRIKAPYPMHVSMALGLWYTAFNVACGHLSNGDRAPQIYSITSNLSLTPKGESLQFAVSDTPHTIATPSRAFSGISTGGTVLFPTPGSARSSLPTAQHGRQPNAAGNATPVPPEISAATAAQPSTNVAQTETARHERGNMPPPSVSPLQPTRLDIGNESLIGSPSFDTHVSQSDAHPTQRQSAPQRQSKPQAANRQPLGNLRDPRLVNNGQLLQDSLFQQSCIAQDLRRLLQPSLQPGFDFNSPIDERFTFSDAAAAKPSKKRARTHHHSLSRLAMQQADENSRRNAAFVKPPSRNGSADITALLAAHLLRQQQQQQNVFSNDNSQQSLSEGDVY